MAEAEPVEEEASGWLRLRAVKGRILLAITTMAMV
jgi:hypothetical protein